jgi:hypothetical protein
MQSSHFHHRSLAILTVFCALSVAGLSGCSAPPDPRQTGFRVVHPGLTAEYDAKSGQLKRIEMDQDKNGRMDTFSYWDGPVVRRIDLDLDEDGVIEKREYYGANNKLERIATSRRGDDIEDGWEFYDEGGRLIKEEADENRDGLVDRRYVYGEPPGQPGQRVLVMTELEFDRSGTPRFRVHYRPDGTHERTEVLGKP